MKRLQLTRYDSRDTRCVSRSARTIAQKYLIMQNKPNFQNAQMNVSVVITKYYENISLSRRRQNKAKQTQFKANSNPIKPNSNPIKPNSNPIQSQSNPISNPISNHPRLSRRSLWRRRTAVIPQFLSPIALYKGGSRFFTPFFVVAITCIYKDLHSFTGFFAQYRCRQNFPILLCPAFGNVENLLITEIVLLKTCFNFF